MANKQQIKAQQAINFSTLKQKNIIVNQTQDKHIQVEHGYAYQVILQNNSKVLDIDFDVIAKKVGDDLTLLLGDATTLTFDDYFVACIDLSCVVSLPAAGDLYHVVGKQSVALADGTEVIYVYGDKSALQEIAFGESALLQFLNQSHVSLNPSSSWSIGAGALAVLGLAGGGGGINGDGSSSTLFTISGDISAGQVVEGHDLILKVYDKDDSQLGADATIEDDGSFSINIKEKYIGYVILKVTNDSKKDYIDEGTGEKKDLAVVLRVVVYVNGEDDVSAMVNPLTEIIARKVLGSNSKLADVDDIAQDLSDANTAVGKAFNVEGVDITSTKPVVVNADSYSGSDSAKDLGYALAGISGMESQDRNGDTIKTMEQVLSSLVTAIDDNGVLAEETKKDFSAGLNQAQTVNTANIASDSDYIAQFMISIMDIEISEDTTYAISDTDSDFITKIPSQTISATLKEALSSEKLWGSVDSGATWEEVSVTADSVYVSWSKDLQEGRHIIQFAITENTVVDGSDVAANVKGTIALQSYTLDTTAPNKAGILKITDNDGILTSGKTTNDARPTIRIDLKLVKPSAETNAKEGDKVQVVQGSSDADFASATLTKEDIDRGYKDVILPTLDAESDNKDYSFKVRIIDQTGNQGVLSDAYLITYDGSVEKLVFTLSDTGSTDDYITNDSEITVSNIEKDAKVEYILDGSDEWRVLETSVTYNDKNKGSAKIDLVEGVYEKGQIKVRQTDTAGNKSKETISQHKWDIDKTAVAFDATEDPFIFRIENEDSDAFESHIVLTFTEDIVKPATFDKSSFSILIGSTKANIQRIGVDDKKIEIVITEDIQTATELKLSYAQSDNSKSLQDKAGNSLLTISEQTFAVDNVAPSTKPVIDSIIDDKGDETGILSDDVITDDATPKVKVTFTDAVEGDRLEFYNSDVKLAAIISRITRADVDKGYKEVFLNLDNTAEGKDYVLGVKLIDKTGNISVISTVKTFTVDAKVAQAKIELRNDTGKNLSDRITTDNKIKVSNIEQGATWEYSTNGGNSWKDGNSGIASNLLTDKFYFDLGQNTEYDRSDIQVRQTDRAGNTNGDIGHTTIPWFHKTIVTDNTKPEYESLTIFEGPNTIVLDFSESWYPHNASGSSTTNVTNAFTVKIDGIEKSVTRVKYIDNKVELSVDGVSAQNEDTVVIEYAKHTHSSYVNYRLQDKAGNLVDNFKVGSSKTDTLAGDDNIKEVIIGNGGNDTLSGGIGSDTFDYNAVTDGNDTISDFVIGSDGDKLDLKDLLSYQLGDTLGDFLSVTDSGDGEDVNIVVNADGEGAGTDISITLSGIGTGALTLSDFETDNLIVL